MVDTHPEIPESERKPIDWLFAITSNLPDDLSAEEYRRRALAAIEQADPHYGGGSMFVDIAGVYAQLARSAAARLDGDEEDHSNAV